MFCMSMQNLQSRTELGIDYLTHQLTPLLLLLSMDATNSWQGELDERENRRESAKEQRQTGRVNTGIETGRKREKQGWRKNRIEESVEGRELAM